jgi:lipopolysaccharide export system permease protein
LNLLDRYIFRSVLASCAAAVGLLVFVLMLGNVIRDLLAYVLTGQLSLKTFAQLTLLMVPFVATYALPMGILTGVLLTLGRLSADSEITAMRSAGIGMPRIARPVFLLALLAAGTALYVNFEAMPHAKVEYERNLTTAIRANPINLIVPKTFIREFPGFVLYIGSEQRGELQDFWLWQLDSDRRVIRFVRAASGHLDYDEHTNELLLTLAHAQEETLNEKNPEDFRDDPTVTTFELTEPIRLSLRTIFGGGADRQPKLLWMTYPQLQAARDRLQSQPAATAAAAKDQKIGLLKIAMTIQEKFTTALAVLSFTLVGLPLGVAVSRRETSANLGVAVALALGYYFLAVMIGWLDQHPEYHPDLLLWLPNVIFICVGLWLFRRLRMR